MKTPSRERYLELGICVIGAILELHDMLETEIFDLRKIVKDIFRGKMTPVAMNALMGEVKKTFDEYEEKIMEELGKCDCENCKEDEEDELTEDEADELAEALAELFSKVGLK